MKLIRNITFDKFGIVCTTHHYTLGLTLDLVVFSTFYERMDDTYSK